MKSPAESELKRLILKFVLLCHVVIPKSSREDKAKDPGECIFQDFRRPKIHKFQFGCKHGDASRMYWVHYKPPVLSYSEVGTYASLLSNILNFKNKSALEFFQKLPCINHIFITKKQITFLNLLLNRG